jgi:uncharacterized protein YhjY with autotransporter beta-barrel domain
LHRLTLAALLLLLPLTARAVGIKARDTFSNEGNAGITNVQVKIVSTAPANGNIVGQYQTIDGTATVADNDYVPSTADFIIFSGQTESQPINLQIVGDTKIEADETFTLNLFNIVNGATLDPGPYVIHIVNDDVPVVTVSSPTITEGNSGTSLLTFVATLTTPAAVAVPAQFSTADGTAKAGEDYQAASGTLTFFPGETTKVISVQINGDTLFEADENFKMNVTPSGGATASGTGTIVNDDVPTVSVDDVRLTEGNLGITSMTFVVSLPAASSATVQATYTTADGTAIAGQDYQSAAGTLTFTPGQTQQNVIIKVIGDTAFEPDETFTLTVTPAGGVPVTATGTIINDDAVPLAGLRIISGNGQRGRLGQPLAQPLVVEVTNTNGATVSGITVDWKVTKGDAQLGAASSSTNAQGRASDTVTLNSVGAVEVQASVNGLSPVTFTLASETLFEQRATGAVAVAIGRALDSICARNETGFAGACRALSALGDAQLTAGLERVAPQESGVQSKVSGEFLSAVTSGISSRLHARRGGVRRFDIQKVSLDFGGQRVPFGSLAMALMPQQTSAPAAEEKDYTGWSGFLSGSLGTGERIARSGNLGFDLDTRGLMLGLDRQFGDAVVGLSANFMNLDSTLHDDAGSVDTTGYALSLYGSRGGLFGSGAHYDGVHLDGSLTLGRNHFDSEHIVNIASLPLSRARSKNDATVYALSGGTGVEAHSGKTDFDLSLSGTWSRADIDDLTEDGAGPLILFVQGHSIDSLVANLGVNVRSVWAVPFGDLLPSVRGEIVHEFKDAARLVTARFLRDHADTAFTIPVDRPDSNYGKLSAGLQAVFPRGVSAFVEVTQDVLRNDLHFRTVQVNVSKSF